MKTLADYVLHVKDVMPIDMCKDLISTYDAVAEKVQYENEGYNFGELNINLDEDFKPFREDMWYLMSSIHKFYVEKTQAQIPESQSYEAPRIKRYEPNEGFFDWHLDSCNIQTAKRSLVMFWYLNDVNEGGETIFDVGSEIAIKPEAGSVVCFPPNYLYPHKGAMPISNSKYVISSYVNLP